MHRRFTVLASFAIGALMLLAGTPASAATPPDSCFAFSSGTITDYYDNEGNNAANPACPRDVDIPSTIGGVTVTTIGSQSFYRNSLTAVSIPSTVVIINHSAFYRNNLTSLVVPNSVTKIDSNAFSNNDLTSLILPNAIADIGVNAFSMNGLTSLTIATSSNLNIGSGAFRDNLLTSVTISSDTLTAGSYAFGVNPIASIVIDSTSVAVDVDAFDYNKIPIESITYNGTMYTAPTTQQLLPESCLELSAGTINDYYYGGINHIASHGSACLATDIVIPDTVGGQPVTSIGEDAFRANHLTAVVMPSTITSIGTSAFVNNFITSIDIPNSVTSIGSYAFYDNQLSSSPLSDGVTTIEDNAFGENHLTMLVIPDSVTSIGDSAFRDNLISAVYVGSGLTDLSPRAFAWQIDYDRFGGDKESWEDAIYSEDAELVSQARGAILLPRVYTSDPNDSQGLESTLAYETYTEVDGDGDYDDVAIIGGYIVNPAQLTLHYRNATNQDLYMTQQFVGQRTDSSYITNYYVSDLPAIPEPSNSAGDYPSPVLTPAEEQAIDTMFTAYYQIGDTVTITPPAIQGYITPPTQTFALASASVEQTIVYAADPNSQPESTVKTSEKLANTGTNVWLLGASGVIALVGAVLLARRAYRRV